MTAAGGELHTLVGCLAASMVLGVRWSGEEASCLNTCRETLSVLKEVQLLTILSHLSIRLQQDIAIALTKYDQFIQWEEILQVSSESIE